MWFPPLDAADGDELFFRAARYKGEPVLTWWEGKATKGLGTGTHVILDGSYQVIARVPARRRATVGTVAEFLITPHDTALVHELRDAGRSTSRRSAGPGRGQAIGGLVQGARSAQRRVLFSGEALTTSK